MSRGHPPLVAIAEAQQKTTDRGAVIVTVHADHRLPFDFVTWEGSTITLVRVRRIKYAGYSVDDIALSCAREIAELRRIPVTDQIYRELHVRGPDRHWHRYLVLPSAIDVIEEIPENNPDDGSA